MLTELQTFWKRFLYIRKSDTWESSSARARAVGKRCLICHVEHGNMHVELGNMHNSRTYETLLSICKCGQVD